MFIFNYIFNQIDSILMLQKLSYFNLCYAIAYLLIYLKSGTFNSSAGIFFIIVFNWLSLRSFQLDNYKWGIWHYITGLWCIYFIGSLIYSGVYIIISSLQVDFLGNDTLIFLAISLSFSLAVLTHIILYWLKNRRK